MTNGGIPQKTTLLRPLWRWNTRNDGSPRNSDAFTASTTIGRRQVGFKVNNTRLRLRFNFTLSPYSYWSLNAVEVEYKDYRNSLTLVGEEPIAPKGFSYRCSSESLVFESGKDTLVLTDYQVQPWLKGADRFSDAYNCVGFTTAPIWAGLFVSAILIGLLFVGILALMDIKTPNKFESTRSKQLTFTVQE